MKWFAYSLSVLACFGLFFMMMKVKGEVTVKLRERAQVAAEMHQLKQDLRVLQAEYAHLANLDRLAILAQQRGYAQAQVAQLQQSVYAMDGEL